MAQDILYNNIISLTEQQHAQCASARTLCAVTMEAVTRLGSHAARGGLSGRSLARTMRVVVMARLARCAWWLWLGSHDARAAGGAAGASQQLLY